MKGNINNRNVLEERTNSIVNRQVRIEQLNLDTEFDFLAAIAALNCDYKLARTVNVSVTNQEKLLCDWIKGDYTKFAAIAPSQYTEKLLNVFLSVCLEKTKNQTILPGERVDESSLFYGFDEKPIIDVIYETCGGEEIRYFDKQLQIPTRLISKLRVRFKVENAKIFLACLDVKASIVNFSFVLSELNRKIKNVYRDVVLNILEEEDADYYSLSKYFNLIANKVQENLSVELKDWGVTVKEASLNQIDIPSNASAVLEHQFFRIRKETCQKKFEQEMAEASLNNYERKAEIHNKYPNFELTLTEAEKDYALNRYLKKIDNYHEGVTGLIMEGLSERDDSVGLNTLKIKPVKPLPPESYKKSYALAKYTILLLIFLIVGVSVSAAASVLVGCLILATTCLIFGMYAAFRYEHLKDSLKMPPVSADYEEQLAVYEAEMTEYEKSLKN